MGRRPRTDMRTRCKGGGHSQNQNVRIVEDLRAFGVRAQVIIKGEVNGG